MRFLFMTLVLGFVLTINVSAQNHLAKSNFEKGTEAAKAKNYEQAIELYERSLQIVEAEFGENKQFQSKIHYNIGVCFYKLKKFKQAITEFEKANLFAPTPEPKVFYALGLSQIELKNLTKAKKSLQKVLQIDIKHGEAWFDLAMIYIEENKFDSAKEAFLNSIEFDCIRSAEAINNIGVILAIEGDVQNAEVSFQKAFLRSNQTLFEARKNLEFIKKYRSDDLQKLLANLIFTKRTGANNG